MRLHFFLCFINSFPVSISFCEDESKKKLAEALMKYTENCMKNLASLIYDSSRKAQISKLFRIKDLNASEITEKIKCINS